MDYDDALAEEKSFQTGGSDDDSFIEDIDDTLEPLEEEGLSFEKEEAEETEEKETY
jgi:hypothetical protein